MRIQEHCGWCFFMLFVAVMSKKGKLRPTMWVFCMGSAGKAGDQPHSLTRHHATIRAIHS
jgi:hypothetical protein